MENYTKVLELKREDMNTTLKEEEEMFKKLTKSRKLQDHINSCKNKPNCKICLKLCIFTKSFTHFSKESGKKLGDITEENINDFFFSEKDISVERSGDSFHVFLH